MNVLDGSRTIAPEENLPNPKTNPNPKPNPYPTLGAFFLEANCPDTVLDVSRKTKFINFSITREILLK